MRQTGTGFRVLIMIARTHDRYIASWLRVHSSDLASFSYFKLLTSAIDVLTYSDTSFYLHLMTR